LRFPWGTGGGAFKPAQLFARHLYPGPERHTITCLPGRGSGLLCGVRLLVDGNQADIATGERDEQAGDATLSGESVTRER